MPLGSPPSLIKHNFHLDEDCVDQGLANFFLKGQVASNFGFAVYWEAPKTTSRFEDLLGLTRLNIFVLTAVIYYSERIQILLAKGKGNRAKSGGNQWKLPKVLS